MTDPDGLPAAAWLDSASPQPGLVVAGVPSSAGSAPGTEAHLTPPRLRRVLERFSTFHGEAEVDLTGLPVLDLGDWPVGGSDPAAAHAAIEERASALDPSRVHAFVGGDNAITRPLANGFGLAGLGMLSFDSRHDVRAPGAGPSHETVVRGLIEDGLPGDRVAQIGIHGFGSTAGHRRYCEDAAISVYPMDTVDLWGIEETVSVALDQLARVSEWIYVDFDLGVLDLAYAPACPHSRPGGLAPRQLTVAALLCGRHPLVRAADFVEVDPSRDREDLTMMNLATAVLAFAAGVAARPEGAA